MQGENGSCSVAVCLFVLFVFCLKPQSSPLQISWICILSCQWVKFFVLIKWVKKLGVHYWMILFLSRNFHCPRIFVCGTEYGCSAVHNSARGAIIFFGIRGVQILQKVNIDKIETPLFQQQKFYDLPTIDTPYLAKVVLEADFLNTISMVILWSLHFDYHKFYEPLSFLFKKFITLVYLVPLPILKNLIAP